MINIDNVLAERLVSISISDVKKPFNEQPRVKVQGELDQHQIDKQKRRKSVISDGLNIFQKAPLDPKTVDNHFMGTIYEELIRKSSEASKRAAGAHFTPREVIKLMVDLLFSPHKEILKHKNLVRSIYDPAPGTGGMLSIASE